VPRRLVQIRIDRHHEVERGERPIELRAVGRGEHGIAGDRDHPAKAALALREDLLGEDRHRELAAELGEAADTALPAPVAALPHRLVPEHPVGREHVR